MHPHRSLGPQRTRAAGLPAPNDAASGPVYEVHVDGGTSILCFDCLEKARNAHHRSGRGDAMRLAVERAPKAR